MGYLPAVAFGASGGGVAGGSSRGAGGVYLPRVDFTAPTPTVPASTLNHVATPIAEQQANLAAENAPLRLCYGRVRLGAQLANIVPHGGHWIIQCVWGEGPIDAVEALHADDAALPAGASVVHYLGTAGQGVDPWLQAAFALAGLVYADTLPYVAYSVVRWPAAASAALPQFVATLRGLKTDAGVWSDNAALALADVIGHERYGLETVVEATGLDATQAACAETVGGAPRRRIGLVVDHVQAAAQWIDVLRTYAGCWVVPAGAEVRLVPDRPRAVDASLTHAAGQIRSLGPIKKRGLAQAPTAIEIRYTDTAALPWREASAWAFADGVQFGSVPRRESQVALPGIQYASQAYREAVERLNKLTLSDLTVTFEVFDDGTRYEVGDIVALTHPWGLDAKPLRILGVDHDYQVHRLTCVEYDPAAYSDAIVAESSTPDTTLPNPSVPPAVASVTLAEALVQYDDGRIESVIDVTWPAVDWPYPVEYLVELIDGTKTLPIVRTRYPRARTPALVEGNTYTVRVAVVGSGIYVGDHVGASLTIQGKLLLPGNVPSLSVFEIGGEVRGTIGAAFDKDMVGYEIRYGPVGCAWALSATVKFVDFVNAAAGVGGYFVYRDAPAGTWDFLVCARDSIGQYSPVPARATVVVTLDVNSYLLGNHAFASPTLTGMAEYHLPGDPARYFVTDDGAPAATTFPGLASGYPAIAATYHAPQTSELVTEAWDIGLLSAGNWSGAIASEALSGVKSDVIRLSADGATWADEGGLSAKANARFGKVKSSATGAATLKVRMGDITLRVDAVPRVFEADVTTLASGVFTVTLPDACAKFKILAFTPLGTSPCTWTFDNLVTGATPAFDLYAFNLAGTQIARAGKLRAETV